MYLGMYSGDNLTLCPRCPRCFGNNVHCQSTVTPHIKVWQKSNIVEYNTWVAFEHPRHQWDFFFNFIFLSNWISIFAKPAIELEMVIAACSKFKLAPMLEYWSVTSWKMFLCAKLHKDSDIFCQKSNSAQHMPDLLLGAPSQGHQYLLSRLPAGKADTSDVALQQIWLTFNSLSSK